jgi:hypothetical protein
MDEFDGTSADARMKQWLIRVGFASAHSTDNFFLVFLIHLIFAVFYLLITINFSINGCITI